MKKHFLILVSILALFSGCKKELELAIIDSECADFTLHSASQELSNDKCNPVSSPGTITGGTLTVNFEYDGPERCLHSINRIIKFYDANNNIVSSVSQDQDTVLITDPSVFISGDGAASFTFTFDMGTPERYDEVSYMTIDFQTQNENGDESNFLTALEPFPCKTIPSATPSDQFIVNSTTLRVTLRDDAAEDGDIITIVVNGETVASNVVIYNTPQSFTFTIEDNGQNTITFYAVNEGTSSPNTVTGSVTDGITSHQFDEGLYQGERITFKLIHQPL